MPHLNLNYAEKSTSTDGVLTSETDAPTITGRTGDIQALLTDQANGGLMADLQAGVYQVDGGPGNAD